MAEAHSPAKRGDMGLRIGTDMIGGLVCTPPE